MRSGTFAAIAVLCVAAPAWSQGNNESLVRQALASAANGQCPDTLMEPFLRATCMQQMPKMGQSIASYGAVTKVTYMGTQPMPNQPPQEVYSVEFASGKVMVWSLTVGTDGKLAAFWSQG